MWRWWRAAGESRYAANRSAMQRLALFSRERLRQLTHQLQLEYERSTASWCCCARAQDLASRSPDSPAEGARRAPCRARCGRLRSRRAGLSVDTPLHAGIHLPDDEIGNCRQFAHLLRGEAQSRGVRFPLPCRGAAHRSGHAPQLVLQPVTGDDTGPLTTIDSSAPLRADGTVAASSGDRDRGCDRGMRGDGQRRPARAARARVADGAGVRVFGDGPDARAGRLRRSRSALRA
jgi:D-amino-acid dehydrogenase